MPPATALVTSRLLRTARGLALLNLLALALALHGAALPLWALGLHLALTVWLALLHVRVAFDAALFADIGAQHYTLDELDDALHTLALRPRGPARSLQNRARGALHLWRLLLLASAAQLALLGYTRGWL